MMGMLYFFFFFKQKTAYEITRWLEFRRVLFRSVVYIDIEVSSYLRFAYVYVNICEHVRMIIDANKSIYIYVSMKA